MATIVTYKLKLGRWTMPKDPDDKDWYGIDLADFLPSGVSIATVAPIVTGVTIGQPQAVIQGTVVLAFLSGMDVSSDDAVNGCTFRCNLSNGAQRDFSIYFTPRDN